MIALSAKIAIKTDKYFNQKIIAILMTFFWFTLFLILVQIELIYCIVDAMTDLKWYKQKYKTR